MDWDVNMEKYTNRLINEKSPYLLQHAHNPVDWYPWSDEAFQKAKNEDRPVLVSIGYSTCHWCHVMERESFTDEEVAKVLNETFVCIKVDREERPDLDSTYMIVSQMMTGSGGWPLNIIMTPDKKPIFALTYIPKISRRGQMGIVELSQGIQELWKESRTDLEEKADEIIGNMKLVIRGQKGDVVNEITLENVYRSLDSNFDSENGGFGVSPKFPSPHNLLFLMRYFNRNHDKRSLEMVEKTLVKMRMGGVYDQIGFGFHRYSTDSGWFLPHFEKMAYDQALLMMVYTDAFVLTGNDFYKHVSDEILEFVKREMLGGEGGFYSAIDADSENEEGKYYTWKLSEIFSVIGEKDGEFIADVFNADADGNYMEEATGRSTGKNVLYLEKPLGQIAKLRGEDEEEFISRVNFIREKLLERRMKRIYPHKDDKILTDMNGLMIAALSRSYQKFSDDNYLDLAKGSADFILEKMYAEGKLLHLYRDGSAGVGAFIDDYAFLTWGLLELYEATFESRYLKASVKLLDYSLEHFWDEKNGGFFIASDESEHTIMRTKEGHDGAIPSGNSVQVLNMLRISLITGNDDLREKACAVANSVAEDMSRGPMYHSFLATAIDFAVGPSFEITVAGSKDSERTMQIIDELRQRYIPNKVTVVYDGKDEDILKLSERARSANVQRGKTAVYVCSDRSCFPPVFSKEEMLSLISGRKD